MTWIKRNIMFVVTAVVGVLLTGWAGYSLMGAMAEDKQAQDDFTSVMNELTTLRNMNPYPTPENIDLAKAEATQMRGLLGEFHKVFAPFPPVPAMDEKGFAAELSRRIANWTLDAKTTAVNIPDQYAFSFSGLVGKLSFASNCIPAYLQQFNEMDGILETLFRAHVNELESIQRVPVYPCDAGGTDFLQTTWVTNQLGVLAPYQVSFLCFSRDLGQVLEGLINSTNCYVVKSVIVTSTKPQGSQGGAGPGPVPGYNGPRPPYQPVRPGAAPKGPVGVTVIREKPLFVTLVIDAVQLKPVATR
jgi:hypothetical protein